MSLTPRPKPPRLAVRAVIVQENKLLLVNAYADGASDLMCAPGGGVEPHSGLPDNLKREVFEETGLHVDIGPLCLVNEFHSPEHGFHQVELFFRCTITAGEIAQDWQDPDAIVTQRCWVTRDELARTRHKPESLARIAFAPQTGAIYDPLERIVT